MTTNLAASGPATTINISSVPPLTTLPAQFTLIQYAAASGDLTAFTLGSTPPSGTPYAGYISNNVANSSIDVVFTSGPVIPPLVWDGANGATWDTSTLNWKTNGVLAAYQQNYPVVRFDDSLTGSDNVTLTTVLTPGSLTVNNSLSNYTFIGTGKISGATGLIKTGSASLTLAQSGGDDYTGGVTINAGTLQIGNGAASGNLPVGDAVGVNDSSTLAFDRADNITVANIISGTGNLVQSGAGILSLTGNNLLFTGNLIVTQGTLQAGGSNSLGTASAGVTVDSGGTFDVDAQPFFGNGIPLSVTVTGAGANSNGAIINSSANQSSVLHLVTLASDASFGGTGSWDIRNSKGKTSGPDAALSTSPVGSPYNLTKVGTNTVTLTSVTVDGAIGNILVQAGTLDFSSQTTSMGDPNSNAIVSTNATLQLDSLNNTLSKVVTLNDGATLKSTGTNIFGGPITVNGIGTFSAGSGAQLTLNASVSGPGSLTKNGTGSLILTSPSTYGGSTLINSGTLALTGAGSVDGSTNITVSAGATLDASGRSDTTLTLTNGQRLQGSGTVLGNLTLASGATIAPGSTAAIGALALSNSVVQLQAGSSTIMKLNKTAGTNDELYGMTSLTYHGNLTVTSLGSIYAAGDIYKLFDAVTYNGSFDSFNLPIGVTWDTSQLAVDGTLRVLAVVTQPTVSGSLGAGGTSFHVTAAGPAGENFRVWSSTNAIARPISNTWTVLLTNGLLGTNGTATFIDNNSTNFQSYCYLILYAITIIGGPQLELGTW